MTTVASVYSVGEPKTKLTEDQRQKLHEHLTAKLRADPTFPNYPKGATQKQIAERIGLTTPIVQNILARKEKDYYVTTLLKLREYTGKSIDDLLGLTPMPAMIQELLQHALETLNKKPSSVPPSSKTKPSRPPPPTPIGVKK